MPSTVWQSMSAINTALAVAVSPGRSPSPSEVIVCEGWVLKKRRKRMQGFARRYFVLYQSGTLAYSIQPGHPFRDQISLPQAAISTAPGRKDIHVDSCTATFHIKCLNTDDFKKWMSAFRKFTIGNLRPSASIKGTHRFSPLNKSGALVEEMGLTLTELEDALATWQLECTVPSKVKSDKVKLKDKLKDQQKDTASVFGLFKRAASQARTSSVERVPLDSTPQAKNDTITPLQRIRLALDALKAQHGAIMKSLQTLSYLDTQPHLGSPFSSTPEEATRLPGEPQPISSSTTRPSKSGSFSSDPSVNEWFDASDSLGDGAQEFVLDVETPPPEKEDLYAVDVTGSASCADQDGSDTDDELDVEMALSPRHKRQATEDDHIVRRTKLPTGPIGDEGSLFAILKKNVGKDLASVTFPVTFNEPMTLLQRAAEEVEYHDLLRQAAATNDPVERIAFIAAFAVSGYAHTRFRSGRKGFSPMLAETFEDSRMSFIAEKVQHIPLVMAYHAEGNGWELNATSSGRTKFWGKSLEIIPLGTTSVRLGDDCFEWKKPSSFMRNLMLGTKYLEHCGSMTIENTTTRSRCVLDFKQSGYFVASNLVSGTIFSSSGDVLSHLEGKWDDQLALSLDSSYFRVLWRVTPFPTNGYGFTSFGITLNEITDDLRGKLPPTDSRFRPDVRALEEGNLDLAELEKKRVEEMQRERRRKGTDMQPRWFKRVGEEWVYAGGYWEQRREGWKDVQSLW